MTPTDFGNSLFRGDDKLVIERMEQQEHENHSQPHFWGSQLFDYQLADSEAGFEYLEHRPAYDVTPIGLAAG